MRRVIVVFLSVFLPVAVWADGMVVPTIAYPANVTIPDQQAAISFSNGIERLVIETRFTGSGTNFAWVIPLPSQPIIEEATVGLFPTLRYICRPEVLHEVPHDYAAVLALIGIGYLFLFVRPTGQLRWTDILACLCAAVAAAESSKYEAFQLGSFFIVTAILLWDVVLIRIFRKSPLSVFAVTSFLSFCLCSMLLPAGTTLATKANLALSSGDISILERKMVGIFETTTITSHDSKALQAWLSDHGYAIPTNAGPVVASYLKNNWVFVGVEVHRENAVASTDTPHPLSFTFKTDKPVYPMRLTGLAHEPLKVDLYVLGESSATAPHFTVETSEQQELHHPTLSQWFGSPAVVTKLTASLSPAEMNEDVWINLLPTYVRHGNRFYSQQGALTTALNAAAYVLAAGIAVVCGLGLFITEIRPKLPWLIGVVALVSLAFGHLRYKSLPQIEVNLMRGGFHRYDEIRAVRFALEDTNFNTMAEARAAVQNVISNPTNATFTGLKSWNNVYVGGQFREEDSPGNYLLRETNNQVEMILVGTDGAPDKRIFSWPLQHQVDPRN